MLLQQCLQDFHLQRTCNNTGTYVTAKQLNEKESKEFS